MIPHEEPEPGDTLAEIRDEVAGLLGRPTSVGMARHVQDVQVAVADYEREQGGAPALGDRVVAALVSRLGRGHLERT